MFRKVLCCFIAVMTLASMPVSTAAITVGNKEVSSVTLDVPKTVRTSKTKFGKTINSNPIRILGAKEGWDIYSVNIKKIEVLKRYEKESEKIKARIEFVTSIGFYFYTNTPGRYFLEIKFKGPSGRLYNISEEYLTEVFVPDGKYSWTKSKKTTMNYNKVFRYNQEFLKHEDRLPGLILGRGSFDTPIPAEKMRQSEPIFLESTNGWELYSVRVIKLELMERYRSYANKTKVKITFRSPTSYYFSANMPGRYYLQVKVISPAGRICELTVDQYQTILSSDTKYSFFNNPIFTKNINKTYRYKGKGKK